MTVSEWYNNYFAIPEAHKLSILRNVEKFTYRPTISLAVPVFNTKEEWLRECIDSVLAQIYTNWELCLCDNASDEPTSNILREYESLDSRIKVTRLETNSGGYNGVNAAVDISTGDYVGLLDSDDILTPDATYLIAYVCNVKPNVKVIYSDEILLNYGGNKALPYFKPPFIPGLLYFFHFLSHLTLYDGELIKRLKLRHCGGSYDYDLALRALEVIPPTEFFHLPSIIYKYRLHPDSTSAMTQQQCLDGACAALQEHLDRLGVEATARRDPHSYQVVFKDGSLLPRPKVDYKAIMLPYGDYPEPNNHLLKLMLGD